MQYNNRLIMCDYLHTRLFQSIRGGPGIIAATIAALLLLLPTTGHTQTPPELFTPAERPAASSMTWSPQMYPWIVRQTYVTVNMPVMTNAAAALTKGAKAPAPQKLTLNLFPDASFVVILDRSYKSPGFSNPSYYGRVEGKEHSYVSIKIFEEDNDIIAVIRPGDGRLFNVSGVNGGIHFIEESDLSKMPSLEDDTIVPDVIEQNGSEAPADDRGSGQIAPELFTPVAGPAEAPTSGPGKIDRWVIRQTYATADPSLLINAGKALNSDTQTSSARKIILNLFPDANFVVVIDEVDITPSGRVTIYIGHFEGNAGSYVSIAVGGGVRILATINSGDGRAFRIKPLSDTDPTHVIKEIDEWKLPREGKPIVPSDTPGSNYSEASAEDNQYNNIVTLEKVQGFLQSIVDYLLHITTHSD